MSDGDSTRGSKVKRAGNGKTCRSESNAKSIINDTIVITSLKQLEVKMKNKSEAQPEETSELWEELVCRGLQWFDAVCVGYE